MRRVAIFSFGCAFLLLSACLTLAGEVKSGVVKQSNKTTIQDPVALGQMWLTTVDQGKYDKSWEMASTYLKSMVTKEQWMQTMSGRGSLGALVSRNLKEKQYFTSLPGAPDGEYYVLTFNTVMKNKAVAVETLTLMQDKDGQLRAAGYFIK